MSNRLTVATLIATFFMAVALIQSCRKDNGSGDAEFDSDVSPWLAISHQAPDYHIALPPHIMDANPQYSDAAKAQLGRVLFYDKSFSADGNVSCGSCHRQALGFSDAKRFSEGVFGRHTSRSSLPLSSNYLFGTAMQIDSVGNSFYPLFWDHRSYSVADQSTQAFTNPVEMNISMDSVLLMIREKSYYPWLFKQAFGDTAVTTARIFTGLTHFMNAINSVDTKFDRAMIADNAYNPAVSLTGFTASENLGKGLYLSHCTSCHGSLIGRQTVLEANNGLGPPFLDPGRQGITGNSFHIGVFKVPALRNIALTAPYMHDGRFATLEEVIEHYNSNVVMTFGIHGDLIYLNEATQQYEPIRLNLTDTEKTALKDFLLTLTDLTSPADERFSNPFR